MTRLTELPALEPDPLTPRPQEVERYVEALQGLSKANADFARRASWAQIRLAGARAGSRPTEAHDSLNRIFRLGVPPDPRHPRHSHHPPPGRPRVAGSRLGLDAVDGQALPLRHRDGRQPAGPERPSGRPRPLSLLPAGTTRLRQLRGLPVPHLRRTRPGGPRPRDTEDRLRLRRESAALDPRHPRRACADRPGRLPRQGPAASQGRVAPARLLRPAAGGGGAP